MSETSGDFSPIAILGYGSLFPPDATTPGKLWENLAAGVSGISLPTPDRWTWERYYSTDKNASEKTYCRHGGFLTAYEFTGWERAAQHGVTELNRTQQLALDACLQASQAIPAGQDMLAGSNAMLLMGNMLGDEISGNASLNHHKDEILAYLSDSEEFTSLPVQRQEEIENEFLAAVDDGFPDLTGTSPELILPTHLPRVVARALGMKGPAFLVDSACASGLLVVDTAIRYLQDRAADTVVAVAVMGNMAATGSVAFSKIGGLSPGLPRPLDRTADGLIPAEGAGALIMKRLDDALAAGDPVKAVIRGIATRTDGKGKAIYAPSSRGQSEAMRRALDLAQWSFSDVDHVEMHATGTPSGDMVEVATLVSVAEAADPVPAPASISIGSMKGLIGHSFPAAGMANLIKILVSMERGELAPTVNVPTPLPQLADPAGPFVIRATAHPWPAGHRRRRAMANAFGFGGVNTSICVEDFDPVAHAELIRQRRPSNGAQTRSGRAAIVGVGLRVGAAQDLESLGTAHDDGPCGYPLRDLNPRLAEIHDPAGRRRAYPIDFEFPWREYRVPPATLPAVDRAQQLALIAAGEALKDARTAPSSDSAVIVGAFAGLETGILSNLLVRSVEYTAVLEQVLARQQEAGKECADFTVSAAERVIRAGLSSYIPATTDMNLPGYMDNIVPGRIGNVLDLRGANIAVDAGQCSFGAALDLGLRMLRHGECSGLLVGGVSGNLSDELLIPLGMADSDAGGIPAEAAVFFLLKPVEDLTVDDRVHAVIEGIDARPDLPAPTSSPAAPDYLGAQAAVRLASALRDPSAASSRRVVMPLYAGGCHEVRLTFPATSSAPKASPLREEPPVSAVTVPVQGNGARAEAETGVPGIEPSQAGADRCHRVWSQLTLAQVHQVLAALAAGRIPEARTGLGAGDGLRAGPYAGWNLGMSWETEEELGRQARTALRLLVPGGGNGQGKGPGPDGQVPPPPDRSPAPTTAARN